MVLPSSRRGSCAARGTAYEGGVPAGAASLYAAHPDSSGSSG